MGTKKYYLRFGSIPYDEKSSIWAGDSIIGKEKGVSVYEAIWNGKRKVSVALSLPITGTTLNTFRAILEYDSRPCYIVTGDYVGRGTDNEPLLRNINIIKQIKYRRSSK